MFNATNIHQALVNAMIPVDHHESDLYAKDCEATRKTLDQYQWKSNCTLFKDETHNEFWWDIPFAYIPSIGSCNPGKPPVKPQSDQSIGDRTSYSLPSF